MGTEDGVFFWVEEGGKWEDLAAGRFSIGKYSGTVKNGVATLDDGHAWVKMVPKTDFHEMPKETASDFVAREHECPCCHAHITKTFAAAKRVKK